MQITSTASKKMLVAFTIGSIFEIFDFLSFIFLAPIIAALFFPQHIYAMATLFTYVTIAVSYLLRPIGGIILGNISDKYGRKTVFTLSILLMSLPSLIIGLLPTFAQIGYAATVLMLLMRILQGFSLGAEVPGSITYIAEKFKHANFYLYLSLLTFGANCGVAIAAESIKLLNQLTSHHFMYTIGWRLPFLIGSLLALIGFYIRTSVAESEEFLKLQQSKRISTTPILTLLREYKLHILVGIVLAIPVSVTTSVFHIILPALLVSYSHFNLQNSIGLSSIGAITLAIFSPLCALLTRNFSPITIVRVSLMSLILIFGTVIATHSALHELYGLVILISLALSGVNGVFFGLLARLFPTQVRFSGIALCYNLAFILGAGITPVWTSIIVHTTGSYTPIIIVCLGVAVISLINTQALKYLHINVAE